MSKSSKKILNKIKNDKCWWKVELNGNYLQFCFIVSKWLLFYVQSIQYFLAVFSMTSILLVYGQIRNVFFSTYKQNRLISLCYTFIEHI